MNPRLHVVERCSKELCLYNYGNVGCDHPSIVGGRYASGRPFMGEIEECGFPKWCPLMWNGIENRLYTTEALLEAVMTLPVDKNLVAGLLALAERIEEYQVRNNLHF